MWEKPACFYVSSYDIVAELQLQKIIMKIYILATALTATFSVAGCSQTDEGPSKETKIVTVTVPEFGISIEAPANWALQQETEDSYFLKGPGGQIQLQRSTEFGRVSLDELGNECSVKVLKKEMVPGGAFFVLCDSKQAGKSTKAVKVELSTGKKTSVRCLSETSGDPKTIESVCKTLRKAKNNT